MKEINERSVTGAKVGIVILGTVRGILYAVCALLTFLYSYLMLNAMNTTVMNAGRWGGGWYMNAYASLMGIDQRDFYRFDYGQFEEIMEFFSNIESIFGPNWANKIYFCTVIFSLAVCVLLYFWARRLRVRVALSEKD